MRGAGGGGRPGNPNASPFVPTNAAAAGISATFSAAQPLPASAAAAPVFRMPGASLSEATAAVASGAGAGAGGGGYNPKAAVFVPGGGGAFGGASGLPPTAAAARPFVPTAGGGGGQAAAYAAGAGVPIPSPSSGPSRAGREAGYGGPAQLPPTQPQPDADGFTAPSLPCASPSLSYSPTSIATSLHPSLTIRG